MFSAEAAEVVSVKVARTELTAANVPALRELFHLERLPLAEAHVEIEIRGVPTAVVNAIRRAITDEMPGAPSRCRPGLRCREDDRGLHAPPVREPADQPRPPAPTDPPDVVAGLELAVDMTNGGTSVLSVYTGDLVAVKGKMPEPLFNPTFKIATIQPGKRLVISGIKIATGAGRDEGAFMVTRRAAFRHLDIDQHPTAATHDEGGVAVDESGYKVSSLVATPRHHVLTATVPAASANFAEVHAVFADACANIQERLRLVITSVERRAETQALAPGFATRGVQYTVVSLEGGLSEGILLIPGETHTIGELLRRAVFELTPEVANVSYVVVSHENRLRFSLRYSGDVTRVLLDAARACVAVLGKIQGGIMRGH